MIDPQSRFASTMGTPGGDFDQAAAHLLDRIRREGGSVADVATHAVNEPGPEGQIWIVIVVRYIV